LLLATRDGGAERINQEGRILGPAPVVSTPTLFNTAAADAIVSAMQILPVTNPWNEDISHRPRLANSDAMIAQIKSDLSPTRQNLRAFYEMNYVLVPNNEPRLTIPFLDYPDESDLDGGTFPNGNYPIPPNMPIESWPQGTGSLTLSQWQMDVNNNGGDRHGIMVAPGSGSFWETWQMKLTQSGWQASNGAKFDLNSNALRPAGWTSGDAAGLPMFPAVPRFDECERGMVEHAMRTDGRSEVYELDATARLLNISTRALVGGGDNVMIAGLILNGTDNGTICFRTLGPSLAAFGVQGVIADPRLDLFNAQGTKLGANNNWKDSQQNAIQSAGLAPGNDTECALLTNLAPGNYTAIVSGIGGATGVALVEAYHLP